MPKLIFTAVIFMQTNTLCSTYIIFGGFPGGSVVKNLPASVVDTRDTGSISGSGRYPAVGSGNPL